MPTALLPRFGTTWETDGNVLVLRQRVGDVPVVLRLGLDGEGLPSSVVFDRWGDPDGAGQWAWHPFGGTFAAWRTVGGVTIPSAGFLGWHYGTDRWRDGEFFRYRISHLQPLMPRPRDPV